MSASLLLIAARDGNVDYLIEALATQPIDNFFIRTKSDDDQDQYNIIHIAVLNEQAEFLREVLSRLPNSAVQLLLCQEDFSYFNSNAFHFAALRGNLSIVKLLVDFYKLSPASSSSPTTIPSSSSLTVNLHSKPWLTVDVEGKTPLLVSLDRGKDECALELMALDMELVCNMVDNKCVSPLLQAVRRGCPKAALQILTSALSYSTSGDDELTPLDVVPNCSEEVCNLLLDKHPEMIKDVAEDGMTFLHKWVIIGKVWPFELLLRRDTTSAWRKNLIDLLCMTEKSSGNNPFHLAAYNCTEGTVQIAQLLVEACIDAYEKEKAEVLQVIPWKRENKTRDTPLMAALLGKHEKLALYFLSVDMEDLVIYATKSILYASVRHGCDEAAQMILTSLSHSCLSFMQLKANGGQNVLHVASNCTERTCNLLIEKLPWLINEPDDNGKTALDVASELGTAWLIKLLLTKDPSSFASAPFAWIEACKKGHLPAIDAFINHSPDFRTVCLQANDSPLHHIQLRSYKEYQEFLGIPLIQEMANMLDISGSTPLHRALEKKDMLFAEVLLSTPGVSRSIKDKSGTTATNLLVELCNQDNEWDTMCKRIRINPRLIPKYIRPNSIGAGASIIRAAAPSAGEMRGTLSVVAALLATLTFAAGFTLPGGFNQETGEALLAKKASFLVFILADTYAMCCSMLVLFCLMWSMVCDQDRSLLLVDRSVLILIHSLYGTLLAFMTGVFTVISQKSLWASILVFFMCSLVAISANKSVLFMLLDKLAPTANRERKIQIRSLEEGRELISGSNDTNQKSE